MTRATLSLGAIALPFAAEARVETLEWARRVIVLGCAAALILAGQSLPF